MSRLNGVDIAGYQAGIDCAALTADFVIVKATEGVQGTVYNPDYTHMAEVTEATGKLLGFYHYANGGDPIAEADCFWAAVSAYRGRALLCLDWESQGNPTFGSGGSVEWCKAFLDHLRDLSGSTPVLYTSKGECTARDWSSVAASYPLWGAEYAYEDYTYQGYESDPWQSSAAWGAWGHGELLHQYGYVLPRPNDGGVGALDGDVFNGSREDWQRLCGGATGVAVDWRGALVASAVSRHGQPYASMDCGEHGWGCAMHVSQAYNDVFYGGVSPAYGTSGMYGSCWSLYGSAIGEDGWGDYPLALTDSPERGDIVLYLSRHNGTGNDASHAALYLGDGRISGANGEGVWPDNWGVVEETSIEEQAYGRDWVYATWTGAVPSGSMEADMGMGCIVVCDDAHSGYKKGMNVLWTPDGGFEYVNHPDSLKVLDDISTYYTGKPMMRVHSGAKYPWIERLRQVTIGEAAKKTFGKIE